MKQKELAEKYGVTAPQIGKLRKKLCKAEDYCEKTKTLTTEGVAKIDNYFAEKDDNAIEPKFVRVQALSPTPNRLFWYCKLLEKPVRKVKVSIPSTHLTSIRPQLVFKAQEIEKNNEKFYRHEIIHKREVQREQRAKKVCQ
jgi:hypothetical protein